MTGDKGTVIEGLLIEAAAKLRSYNREQELLFRPRR
jgi:hypothetical protein